MADPQWSAVDQYFESQLLPHDPILLTTLEAMAAAGLPPINVSPLQGKLLHVLARSIGARRILEIGTLGGYSTIWLGRALPTGGTLISLEIDPRHAEVARANLARAGLSNTVQVRVGPALETLPKVAAEGGGQFDLVFIDADKVSNAAYFEWAVRLTRRGGLILVDNVVRGGAVTDAQSEDEAVRGVRRLFERMAHEGRVAATAIQTVGSKGYDGLAMAVVL